jgi:hypothetical protein
VAAVVAVMSVQPTSEKTTLSQPSAAAAPASASVAVLARRVDFNMAVSLSVFVD